LMARSFSTSTKFVYLWGHHCFIHWTAWSCLKLLMNPRTICSQHFGVASRWHASMPWACSHLA
jgi:hypothetical protein